MDENSQALAENTINLETECSVGFENFINEHITNSDIINLREGWFLIKEGKYFLDPKL